MAHLDPGLNRRIAVIGGGWAGLAAAVTLVERGARVTLYELAPSLGGRARRVELEGCALDNGQHILVGAYRETLQLMRQVGADPDALLRRTPLRLQMSNDVRIAAADLPAPWGLAYGLLRAQGLSWRARGAAIAFMRRMQRAGYRLERDRTVAQLLDEHRQHGILRHSLWEPLCVAALNTPAQTASAQIFLNVLRDTLGGARGASDLLLPRGDLGRLLPDPAARWLRERGADLRLGTHVRELAIEADAITVSGERFDGAVLAVGPQHAAVLLPTTAGFDAVRAQLARFAYEPIHTCYLQYDAGARLRAPMLGFAEGMVQWAFDRGALDGPPGLMAAVISARGPHEDVPRDSLLEHARQTLSPLLRDAGRLHWGRVIVEKRATFSCMPDLERPPNETPEGRLVLAGDYTGSDYPATLEGAVRSGRHAASLLVQKCLGA